MTKTNKGKKTEGFFRIDHSLVKDEAVIARVGVNAWAVYTILLSYVNKETGLSYPSYKRIKEKTGMGQSTVSKALDKLEEHGLVEQKSKGTKQGDNNTYLIHPHPTKNVESDGKRKMSRPKPVKPGKTKKDDISPPIDAQPVTLKEPVKVSKPEIPNKLSEEDIIKSFSDLFSLESKVKTIENKPIDESAKPLKVESVDNLDNLIEEVSEAGFMKLLEYNLDELTEEVCKLGRELGRQEYRSSSYYSNSVNGSIGSRRDKLLSQLKLKKELLGELGRLI